MYALIPASASSTEKALVSCDQKASFVVFYLEIALPLYMVVKILLYSNE